MSGIVNSSASRVESLSANNNDANALESCLSFLVEGMAFLNAFVQSAPDLRHQVVIQWEVEEAALNIDALSQVGANSSILHSDVYNVFLRQVAETTRSPLAVQLKHEIALWNENLINIALLLDRLTNVTCTNEALRKDLLNLRSRLSVSRKKRRVTKTHGQICRERERERDFFEEKVGLIF